MKVLHLLSDWKWTGSSEPVVSLCEALAVEGLDVTIAYRKTPAHRDNENSVGNEVKKRGIPYFEGFRLNRYFSLRDWLYDIINIKRYVENEGVDIVHTNLSHDHFLALLSLQFCKKRPLIIRTDHKRDGIPKAPFMKWALFKTDFLMAYSRKIIDHDIRTFRYPGERTCIIPPGVKLFNGELENIRHIFPIDDSDTIIGVVGRLKKERGYDTIFKAFKLVRDRMGKVKLLVLGRGSPQDESIVHTSIADLGIGNDVILAGYRPGDYFSIISAFDIFVMMRAGTDGTARALREVMSMGVPPVVSDLGMLPELVDDGINGFVVKPQEDVLAEKIIELLLDKEKRQIFGKNAKETAQSKWSYKNQAVTLMNLYKKLLKHPRRKLRGI
jgi:glycosyltransferase involved in cell wall biosynthesis